MAAGRIVHRLNGTAVADPIGAEDFAPELVRDWDLRLITTKPPEKLTFHSDGWALLRGLWQDGGWCQVVQYRAEEEDAAGNLLAVTFAEIFLADTEWDLARNLATCSLADKGFGARIRNNADLEAIPTGTKSKNGEDITAATTLALQLFDPQDALATYLAGTAQAWNAWDALRHLLDTITDGTVILVSDHMDGLQDEDHLAVAMGRELRLRDGTTDPPALTWAKLWTSLSRLLNLWGHCWTDANGQTYLRAEPESYWQGTAVAMAFDKVDGVTLETDTDRLPSAVKLGQADAIKGADAQHSLPLLFLRGFAPDTVTLAGTCNGPDTLELGPQGLVIDSNTIEELANSTSGDQDDALVLVQYTASTQKATKSDTLNPGAAPYIYNDTLQNFRVLSRYSLPAAGVSYRADQDDAFAATFTAGPGTTFTSPGFGPDTTTAFRQQFDNDFTSPNMDPNNNWGNGTTPGNPVAAADSRYTAPAQGYFSFRLGFRWELLQNTHTLSPSVRKTVRARVEVRRYAAGGGLLETRAFTGVDRQNPGQYLEKVDAAFAMQAGEYVEAWAWWDTDPQPFGPIFGAYVCEFRASLGCSFATTWTATGGGQLPQGDPLEFTALLYKFEGHIPTAAWLSLTEDPRQAMQLSTRPDGQDVRTAYLKSVKRNSRTGMARLELIANRNQPWT